MATITVDVLFFAAYRERLSEDRRSASIAANATVADLLEALVREDERYQFVRDETRRMIAVNQSMARADTVLTDGDEIAFFPPVTGG